MRLDLATTIEEALADLTTIESVVPAQARRIVAQSAQRLDARLRATTRVGRTRKPAGKRLSTGWQRRIGGPLNVQLANVRPHAHLAAEGWDHVGGQRIAPFVPWLREAVQTRAAMGDELTALVGLGFPAPLRALEVAP